MQSGTAETCSAITPSDLCPLVEAGQLSDLRWPNFSDLRKDVRDFYLPFNYALTWTKESQPTPQARALIHLLQDADKKGLRAEDYDGPFWNERLARLTPPAPPASSLDLARFDLALTISVMRYISALHNGRVTPRHLQLGLDIEHKRYKLGEFLRSRLVGAQDVNSVVEEVEPSYAGYRRTRTVLEHYLALAREGEGDPLPAFKKPLKPGDAYPGLNQLTKRLQRLGDLPPTDLASPQATVYKGELVEGVKRFQQRHGLQADGAIGRATFNQLTTPLSRRVAQLQLTLERWRWLPPDLPRRIIAVNVPEFQLRAYDDHHPSLAMRVVVGKAFPELQTPVFQDQLEYLIFHPYWNVPIRITRKELIPAIRKNPSYLAKHGFELVNRAGQSVAVDITDKTVMTKLGTGEFWVRQKPGPENALGPIKFVFPNNYAVYLHGTPERALFSHSRRTFSHGCIRVEDPSALAAWVLHDAPSWTSDRIQEAINGADSVRVDLPVPIPVLVLYGTALVDENEEVHFFEDVYGQDKKLEQALARGYPYPR
ncbi:MAG: L,D-transpeptidase family protein [Acidobacteriia bacterium]|nr:L,D-transpeptidase family protein [Terriglobia bacterium]